MCEPQIAIKEEKFFTLSQVTINIMLQFTHLFFRLHSETIYAGGETSLHGVKIIITRTYKIKQIAFFFSSTWSVLSLSSQQFRFNG